jgi:alpha-beta hydrolase superfamily lysophospholipase
MNSKVYPGMKHEVLHEVDKQIVYDDIVRFFSLKP